MNDDGSVECWLNTGKPDNGPNPAKITWIQQDRLLEAFVKMELACAWPT